MPPQRPGVGLNPQAAVTATATIAVDANGEFVAAAPQAYPLAANGALTPASGIRGGNYLWSAEAAAWNGATATLQVLGLDGSTWRNMRNQANTADITLAANGSVAIVVGQGSSIRIVVSGGAPTALFSTLAGF